MTDKTIINGVDISGCEHYDEVCLGNHHYKWCKDNDNCYYKQLVRKEQEIIKLKQTLSEIKWIAEENMRIADLEGLNGVYRRGLAKQILQKISESEVENAR